jgi:biopolymer transport protein ExbB/TolQ
MDASNSHPAVESGGSGRGRDRGELLKSGFLWGGLATLGFYAAVPYLPVYRNLVERYFCSHPTEYILAALFFVGMAILLGKAIGTWAEKRALASGLLDGPDLMEPSDPVVRAVLVEEKLNALSPSLQETVFAGRVRDACLHVRSRKSAAGLNDHLKYLADVAADRLHAGYALVRTITWAVPILGFLGTVIGITLAISNLTPEQLESSLNAVTGGLGVAFDTTALALTLSVVLVFMSFVVERAEQGILVRVEDLGVQRITALFPDTAVSSHPLADAELQAAQTLISQTDALIRRQTELWNEALESTRGKWLEVMQVQKQDFDATLRNGMQATLDDHWQQLAQTRADFLSAFQSAADTLQETMADSRAAQRDMQREFGDQFGLLWHNVQGEMRSLHEDQRLHLRQITGELAERVAGWQNELRESTVSSRDQIEELKQQSKLLLQLSAQEERLARLQQQLTDNLDALRGTESFEETLHSLTAAVHLLTARAHSRAA